MRFLTPERRRKLKLFALNFAQGLLLLASILLALGSGASFMANRIDLQNLQQTTHDMISSLSDEIVIASQVSSTLQQPVVLLPGVPAPQAPEPDSRIEQARQRLHNATFHWSARDYPLMLQNLTAGYELLDAKVPLKLADNDLLTGATKCLQRAPQLDPKSLKPVGDTRCVLKVPLQSWRLAQGSLAAGIGTALFAALSPPTVRMEGR